MLGHMVRHYALKPKASIRLYLLKTLSGFVATWICIQIGWNLDSITNVSNLYKFTWPQILQLSKRVFSTRGGGATHPWKWRVWSAGWLKVQIYLYQFRKKGAIHKLCRPASFALKPLKVLYFGPARFKCFIFPEKCFKCFILTKFW